MPYNNSFLADLAKNEGKINQSYSLMLNQLSYCKLYLVSFQILVSHWTYYGLIKVGIAHIAHLCATTTIVIIITLPYNESNKVT